MSMSDKPHNAIFSYGSMRAAYVNSDFPSQGSLSITQFVRPEYSKELHKALIQDKAIFLQHPNTLQQNQLSPVSRQCLWELQSGIMIRLLENMTGITHLLPDTHCNYSGLDMPDTCNTLKSALRVSICLITGDAVIKKIDNTEPFYQQHADTFYMHYWQSPALLGETAL